MYIEQNHLNLNVEQKYFKKKLKCYYLKLGNRLP